MNRILTLLLGVFFIGCSPYKCFYKETYTANKDIVKEKVYRLVLDGSNQLDSIQLTSLDRLESFKLTNISLEKLEETLMELPNPEKLNVLILDSLNLKKLPNALSRFTNLHHISLNNNPLLNFEAAFTSLKDLPIEFINLQYNKLTTLPESITQLKTLKELNLSNNTISGSKTFEILAKLPKLYSLWLTNNKLDSLPVSIGGLSQLRNLYIEHNQLAKIPAEIVNMKKVWVIHAGHNFFEELPEEFAIMPSLILLHVNNCNIKNIPAIYNTKKSNVLGLVMDKNKLSDNDKLRWEKNLKHYFLLSLE